MSFDVTKPFCSKPMQHYNGYGRLYPRQKKKIIKPTNHPVHRSIVVSHRSELLSWCWRFDGVHNACIWPTYTLEWTSAPGVSGTQNQLQDWVFNTQTSRTLKVNNIIPLVNSIVFQDKLLYFSFETGDWEKN